MGGDDSSPRRRVTAADVAKAAGVSATTVSYVLNDRPHQSIPESTRRKVIEAASRLGYAPSAAARALATGRSDLVLGLMTDWPVGANLGQFARRLTAAFAARGYAYVGHTISDAEGPDTTELLWRTISPAAVVVFDDIDEGQLVKMRAAGASVTIVAWTASGTGRGVLEPVDRKAGRMQAQHLLDSGHRRLGYAWPDDVRLRAFARPRLAGVEEACAEAGIPAPEVRTVPLTVSASAAAIVDWREQGVGAVCAYNDESAIALLDGLRHLQLTAPDDLAVIGVDDLPTSALTDPPLTTVNYDRTSLTDHLAAVVVDAINGGTPPEPRFVDFVRLVRRDTA